jgi:parallel beta-helix repeat protein
MKMKFTNQYMMRIKNNRDRVLTGLFISGIFFLAACNHTDRMAPKEFTTTLEFMPGDETKIVEAFLSLKDSSEIHLKEGTYKFDNLSLALLNHIQIRGDGPDKTILDFSLQSQGGEGIRVTDTKFFTIRDMTIRDSKGDLLKISKSDHVDILNLHATWKTSDSTSGGYAIYPVMCHQVLIDSCYAEGSSDAGIYVGQTDSAVVRNCKAFRNVAGCEIENTSHANVYDNEFYGNTAGFLAFDLPGLSRKGGFVKAYHNNIHDNNLKNFAKSGSFGTYWGVGNASPGSGVIVLSASNIEIFENQINNNNSSAIALASGLSVDDKALEKINENYNPISSNISIHDNTMTMGSSFPEAAYAHHIGKLLVAIEQKLDTDTSRKNKRIPFIMYDGISTNILSHGTKPNPDSLCIRQTGDNVFVNADFLNMSNPSKWHPGTDWTMYKCN